MTLIDRFKKCFVKLQSTTLFNIFLLIVPLKKTTQYQDKHMRLSTVPFKSFLNVISQRVAEVFMGSVVLNIRMNKCPI